MCSSRNNASIFCEDPDPYEDIDIDLQSNGALAVLQENVEERRKNYLRDIENVFKN